MLTSFTGCYTKFRSTIKKSSSKLFKLDVWRWGLQAISCCVITCPLATVPFLSDLFSGSGTWAVQTSILVLENTTGATIKKSAERIVGTIGGGLVAYLFVLLAFNKKHNVAVSRDQNNTQDSSIFVYSNKFEAGAIMLTYIVLSPFFWALIRMKFPNNVLIGVYGLLTSHLVAGGAFLGSGALQIAAFRVIAVVLGVLANTFVIHFVFPNRARDQFESKTVTLLKNMSEILKPIVELEAGFEPDSAKEVIAVNKRTLKEFAAAKLRRHPLKKKKKNCNSSEGNLLQGKNQRTFLDDNSIFSLINDDQPVLSNSLKQTPSKVIMNSGISSKIEQPQDELVNFTQNSSKKNIKSLRCISFFKNSRFFKKKTEENITTDINNQSSNSEQKALYNCARRRLSNSTTDDHFEIEPSSAFHSPSYFAEVSQFAQQKLKKSLIEFEGLSISPKFRQTKNRLPVQLMHEVYMAPKSNVKTSEHRHKSHEILFPINNNFDSSVISSVISDDQKFSRPASASVSRTVPLIKLKVPEKEASRPQSPNVVPQEGHGQATSDFSVVRTVSSASQLSMYINQQKIDYELLRGRTLQELATSYVEQVVEAEQRRKLRWNKTLEIIEKCQSLLGTLPQLLVAARQEVSLYSKNVPDRQTGCSKKSIFFPKRQYQRLLACLQHLFNQIASLFFSIDFQLTQVSRAKVESLYEFFESLHIENALTFSHAAFSAFADQWKCCRHPSTSLLQQQQKKERKKSSCSVTKRDSNKDTLANELAPTFFTTSKDLYVLRKLFAGITGAFLFTEVFGSIVSKAVGHIQVALIELAKAFEDRTATERALKAITDTAEAIWIFTSIRNERSRIYIDIFDAALRAEEQNKRMDSLCSSKNSEMSTNFENKTPELPWETLIGLDPQIFTNMTKAEHRVFWQSYWRARDRLSVTSGTLMVLRDQLFLLRNIIEQLVNPNALQTDADIDFC